jgi:hypothetical protein
MPVIISGMLSVFLLTMLLNDDHGMPLFGKVPPGFAPDGADVYPKQADNVSSAGTSLASALFPSGSGIKCKVISQTKSPNLNLDRGANGLDWLTI